jgi:hypothetical protein
MLTYREAADRIIAEQEAAQECADAAEAVRRAFYASTGAQWCEGWAIALCAQSAVERGMRTGYWTPLAEAELKLLAADAKRAQSRRDAKAAWAIIDP